MLKLSSRRRDARALFLGCMAAMALTMMNGANEARADYCAVMTGGYPLPGLVAWWPGDGNTRDIIGLPPNNGVKIGAVGYTIGGVRRDSFAFAGTGRISVAPINSWKFTISAWVQPWSLAGYRTIYADDGRGLFLKDGKPTWWSTGGDKLVSSASVGGGWQHVAITYDGSEFNSYLNGSLIGNARTTSPESLGTGNGNGIGGHTLPTENFIGSIDEVAIFNRPLTQPEIRQIGEAVACRDWDGPAYDIQVTSVRLGGPTNLQRINVVNVGSAIPCWATLMIRTTPSSGVNLAACKGAMPTGTMPTGTVHDGVLLPVGPAPNCAAASLLLNGNAVAEKDMSNNLVCN